jgi:tetratricopeptide (TPR) repeat protein
MLARRARLLLALDRLDEATATLERLRSVEPESAWAHLTLARTLSKARRIDVALEAADALLARFPEDLHGLSLKARLLAKLGRNEDAAEAARQAARVGASDAGIMREIGPLLRRAAA